MASINIAGDTSGSISLTVPSVAGTNTVTIPANSGVVMVSGNMPAFSAYSNNTQNVSSNVLTKIAINTKVFDTNTNFDATTNYRFTPTVAGYYQVNGALNFSVSSGQSAATIVVYKNGSAVNYGNYVTGSYAAILNISLILYLNGSTDYIEIYGQLGGTGPQFIAGSNATYFQAAMIRGS